MGRIRWLLIGIALLIAAFAILAAVGSWIDGGAQFAFDEIGGVAVSRVTGQAGTVGRQFPYRRRDPIKGGRIDIPLTRGGRDDTHAEGEGRQPDWDVIGSSVHSIPRRWRCSPCPKGSRRRETLP